MKNESQITRRKILKISVTMLLIACVRAYAIDDEKDKWDEIKDNVITKADNGWWEESMKTHEQRVEWWRQARFGCFVHWGVYAQLAGIWEGYKYGGYTEHIQRRAKIDQATYLKEVIQKFNPVKFNADEWIHLVRDTGMKYFIITAKHHDGFAMYDSDVSDYNIVKQTSFKRDPMKELKAACKKYNIKFGFYYSQAFDWGEKYGCGNDWEFSRPGGDKRLYNDRNWYIERPDLYKEVQQKYTNVKAVPQIKELIKKYDPDILWFDTPHKLPFWENLRILEEIRKLSNTIVINGRLARDSGRNFGDYINTGDRAAEFSRRDGDWEGIPTTNESYGYSKVDRSHKPPEFFIQLIAKAASRNGNTLMNIGPRGDGRIDDIDVDILKTIGKWMKKYGESIYKTNNSSLPIPYWGVVTQRKNKLFLHVFKWPENGTLIVGGLKTLPSKAYTLADPKTELKVKKENAFDLNLQVGKNAPDKANSVIVLEFNEPILTDDARLLDTGKTNRLLFFDAETKGQRADNFKYGDGKPRRFYLYNWKDIDQWVSWKFRVNEPVEFDMTLHYYRDKKSGSLQLELDGKSFIKNIDPEVFETTWDSPPATLNLGKMRLKAGEHTIAIKPESQPNDELIRPLELVLKPL